MTLPALATLYLLVGAGCSAARLAWRALPRGRFGDACLLLALWPLFGPFMLLRLQGQDATSDSEVAFLVALRRAGATPLGAVLPDEDTARALAARLRVAAGKVDEIDALLARPEFSEAGARERLDALRARDASECAVSTATMRLQNIRRLRALRDRFSNELDEIRELIMQLTTQAEVVRLAGGSASDSARSWTEPGTEPGTEPWTEIARELLSRVEGLDQMLDDDPQLLDARG